MAKQEKKSLGRLELKVMQVVWEKGEASVREVLRALNKNADYAYTSIMTTMRNLEKKGVLALREQDRAYIYRPLVSRREIERHLLGNFLENVFQGSHEQLVNSLVDYEEVSLSELMEMVKKMDKKKEE